MAIRPVKRRSLSSLNGDPSVLKARIRPTEIITRINKIFGSRNWHAWLEARGTILVTELLVRGHVGRARISPDLLRGESEVTVRCLGIYDDEQDQFIAKIQRCLEPEIFIIRRKEMKPTASKRYIPTWPLEDDDYVRDAIVQPAELAQYFKNFFPTLTIRRAANNGHMYYVMECHKDHDGIGLYPLAEIPQFPRPRMGREVGGVCWFSTFQGAPRLLAKQLQGALNILIHNRGYDPRTLEPY